MNNITIKLKECSLRTTKDALPKLIFKVLLISFILFIGVIDASSQETSRNNYTGNWENSASWWSWPSPVNTGIDFKITINGFITANSSISFSKDSLVVKDTLVIIGDLTLGNNSDLAVKDGGVLIVRGNVTANNQVDIAANAYIIITGNFTKNSASGQGSFTSNDSPSKVFIGGTITIPDGWRDDVNGVFNCTEGSYTNTSCNYGNTIDLAADPIFGFVENATKDLDSDKDGIPNSVENANCNTSMAELFTNGSFTAGNTGFTSSYGYAPGDGHPEGIYTIATNPKSWHNDFSACGDATTGTGNMMIINASGVNNAVVWSSGNITIQPYKTYTFSLKLASVHPTSPAQLIFRINGVDIGSQFNATATTCQWIYVQTTWYSGNLTSTKFEIINKNTAANGNDFALDDISCKYEPDCDTDGDGLYDKNDLDSDNDGIFDIREAGGTDTNNDGMVDNSTDADKDGLADVVDNVNSGHGASEVTNGTPLSNGDLDGDGRVNRIDLDSDGDNCFDVTEAGFTDADGDGKLGSSPVTINSKGKVTSGSNGYTIPADADANGARDYLQKGPVITVQPGNKNVCVSSNANTTFSVTATGAGTYQWQVSTNNGASWTNVPNTAPYSTITTNTLTLTGVTTSYDTYQYRVAISHNAYACSPLYSNPVTLRVSQSVPTIPGTISGASQTCPAISSNYSVVAVSGVTTYNWTVPTGWTINSGAGTSNINVTTGAAGQNGNITVTAENFCGISTAQTLAVTVNSGTLTAPVANAGTAAGCSQITANWTASANATGYYLDVSTSNTFASFVAGFNNLDVSNVTTYNVTGLTSGTTYYYRVRAYNVCVTSASSATITYATLPATPAVPTANAGTAAACSQITANWTASANATRYYLDVSTVNTFATFVAGYNNLNVLNVTSYNVTGLTAGTTYYYRVRAYNTCGTSASSATITYATLPATPAIPTANAGTAATCSQITANWTASANATRYYLDVSTVNTFASYVTGYNNLNVSNVTSYNVTGLTAGTTYYYRVRAYNTCGTSASSATITYATLPATPAVPGAITGTAAQCPALTGQTYSISAVANATTYTWAVPTGWSITAGAGTNSITVTTGAAGQNGNITVTAGNSCGTSTASTKAVTVNPSTATTNPSSATQTQCIGNAFTAISVTATGTGTLTYQWYSNTSASNSGGSLITGATSASYTPASGSVGALYYYCVVSGSCGNSTSSVSGIFTVTPLPTTGEFYRKPNN